MASDFENARLRETLAEIHGLATAEMNDDVFGNVSASRLVKVGDLAATALGRRAAEANAAADALEPARTVVGAARVRPVRDR